MQRDSRDPVVGERLTKVSDAAHHLMDIINDVLDLSKIEAGKITLDEADFAVAPLLQRTVALVVDRARDKGLELVLHIHELPAVLHGDATRLSQALLNLLGNAVKFTDQGSVTLRGEVLEQSAGRVRVRFGVSDNRHRHRCRQAGPPVHRLRAGRQLDHPPLRRHGPRPGDHPAPARA